MGYQASHVATIPSARFQWYLIFLEAAYADDIKKEIDTHFTTLAREVGKDVLVVRGLDATSFRESVREAPAFFDVKWNARVKFPALLVTNRAPAEAVKKSSVLEKGKVLIFPLEDVFREHKSLAGFFTDLTSALKSQDSVIALDSLDGSKLLKGWGWLSKYFKTEPGFYGFHLKLNDAVKDMLRQLKSSHS